MRHRSFYALADRVPRLCREWMRFNIAPSGNERMECLRYLPARVLFKESRISPWGSIPIFNHPHNAFGGRQS
jgi:hypothetical protein